MAATQMLDIIQHYQRSIERCQNDEARLLHCIKKLYSLPVQVEHLQETGVGKTVNSLRKFDGEIGMAAKALVTKWKTMVAAEEESTQMPNHVNSAESNHNSNDDLDNDGDDDNAHDDDDNDNNSHMNSISHSRDKHNKQDKKNNGSQPHADDSNTHSKSSSSHNKSKSSKHKTTSTSHSHYNEERSTEKYHKNHEHERRHEKHEHHKDGKRTNENQKENHHNKRMKEDKIERNHQEEKIRESSKSSSHHRSSDNHSKYEEKHQKSVEKTDNEHKKDASNADNKKRSSSLTKEKESHKSSKSKETSHHHHHHREKTTDKSDTSKSKSTSTHSHTNTTESSVSAAAQISKTTTSSSPQKDDNSKLKRRRSSDNKSDSDISKGDSKKASKKSKSSKSKRSEQQDGGNGIDSSMGANFSDVLGMLDVPTKKTKKILSNIKPTTASTSTINSSSTSKKSNGFDSTSSSFSRPSTSKEKINKAPDLLSSSIKLAPLDPSIALELPSISTNYKPLPLNPTVMDCVFNSTSASSNRVSGRKMTDAEALNHGISSKTIRTKIYSGVKTGQIYQVSSLFDLCIRLLIKNFDALEYTGGVPYDILHTVLERVTPQQLFNFEEYNPYIIMDCDVLWKQHVQRYYRNQKRQEMESWREMFLRCQDEQERKLSTIAESIKQSQKIIAAPVRKTQLAYVDSLVKPPRNVLRKQEQYGTKAKIVATPAARVASLSQITPNAAKIGDTRLRVANPTARDPAQASSIIRPKKAPLMAKTLQLMRGHLKR